MRFLADENVPRAAVEALRAAGHDLARLAVAAIAARDDWAGCFSVIEKDRTRMRPLMRMEGGG